MQPNHLLALIGVVMIASSATGLIVVKEAMPGATNKWDLKTFHASFPIATSSSTDSGSTADGGTGTSTIAIEDVNLTGATLKVTWTDNQPRFRPAADVSVSVSGPQSQSGSGSGSSGSITIDLGSFNTAPNETDVQALDESEATKDAVENNPVSTEGTGDWEVTITVARSGFAGPFRQGSVDWSVTLDYENYSLVLTSPEAEDAKSQGSGSGVSS